jgi:TolB-like protein/tetratricopeptide (TPR) repeat protein
MEPTDGLSITDRMERAETTVFVSYSRADQPRALPIIRLIQEAGFDTWWDGLLEGGERFSQTTEDALDRAQAVVVLWSKTSVHSHWVHDEATRGRDRRILVPLSLDGSPPPLGFGQFQVIDLSKSKLTGKDPAIQHMLRAVEALHGAQVQRLVQAPIPAHATLDRRTLIAGGAVVIAVGGGAAAWLSGLFGGGNVSPRIVVLPFNNIGGDTGQAYVAEGLANEIRATLAQNGAIEVVGQASSEAFERGKQDPVSFAKKLRAGFLVDGAVQIVGNMLRVTIELIDGKTGVSRTNRPFEKPMGDILSVQREIGGAIAAELSVKIGAAGSAKAALGGTANVIAFDHYLRGKDLYAHASDEAEERQAVAQFDAAIAADPNFAAAHAGRARSLAAVSGQYGSVEEIKTYYDAAIASARQAVKLAPNFADAQSALGLMLFQGNFDVKAAREPFDLSRKLGEGEAPVLARFAAYCAATGRDRDALTAVQRAMLLDPLNALIHRISGTVHYAARRFPEAIAGFRQALSINPDLSDTHSRIGLALLAQKKDREALAAFEADTHKWSKLAGVAIAQKRLGNDPAAKAAMEGLISDTETVSLYQQGQVLAQWGQADEAVTALRQARLQRDAGLTAARVDPMLDPLAKRADFISLLKSMGFD